MSDFSTLWPLKNIHISWVLLKVQNIWKIRMNLKFLYVNVSRQPYFLDSILYYCNHFQKLVALGGKKFNMQWNLYDLKLNICYFLNSNVRTSMIILYVIIYCIFISFLCKINYCDIWAKATEYRYLYNHNQKWK